ncbi:hypothetical protein PMIN07_007314 [Paraphaeosphaeria minitans]
MPSATPHLTHTSLKPPTPNWFIVQILDPIQRLNYLKKIAKLVEQGEVKAVVQDVIFKEISEEGKARQAWGRVNTLLEEERIVVLKLRDRKGGFSSPATTTLLITLSCIYFAQTTHQ